MQYRKDIDGLRAFAVIPVVLFHAGFSRFSGGFLGVDIFFVISGYVITRLLLNELENNLFSIKNFYERRARRILPMLYLVLFVTFPFCFFAFLPSDLKEISASLASIQIFSSNFFFWQQTGYFSAASDLKPYLHTWSLAVEEQYYLFFPVFLAIIFNYEKKYIIHSLMLTFLVSFCLAYWGNGVKENAAFFLIPFRAWELIAGSMTAYLMHNNIISNSRLSRYCNQISFLGLVLILLSVLGVNDLLQFRVWAALAVFGSCLIISFSNENTFVGKLLSQKIFVFIGLISYSLYLWHQPILVFCRIYIPNFESSYFRYAVLSFLLVASYLSWKFIEAPFRDKNRFSQKFIFTSSLLIGVLLFGLGIYTYINNGFVNRYPEPYKEIASINPKEAGQYVQRRFHSFQKKSFENDSREKILIVGDSYAEDMTNVFFEINKNIENYYQFRTLHINHYCGNLYVNFDELKPYIDYKNYKKCSVIALKDNPVFNELAENADQIWFISAWMPWQPQFINKSLSELRNQFSNKKIMVFGTKSMGEINLKHLLKIVHTSRSTYRQAVIDATNQMNKDFESLLPTTSFINVQYYLTQGNVTLAPVFDQDGYLLTYDGSHLTERGARFLAKQFNASKVDLFPSLKNEE